MFLFAEHMIYLGHDVFGAQDGSFWVFAVTMGVFGPGWFLISVLNRNQQLIDSEMSEKSAAIEKAESTRNSMFEALNQLSLARDNETGNHILRTQHYVRAIARQLRDSFPSEYGYLDDAYIEALFLAAPLHDIGKVGIPDSILLKPGKLSEAEWTIMQTHALIGENVLSAAGQSGNEDLLIASQVAGGHHEKWDGSGYPRRLKGQDIPVAARIMAIADVYDALTTERVYKSAWQHTEAIAEIQSLEGKQFDPAIVAAFLAAEEAILAIADKFKDDELQVV
jgi:response regulator RpfG family c-di-GMP phosphodiesterase